MKRRVRWLAGWNPGGDVHFPDLPFKEFKTFEVAREYIIEELERVIADLHVGDCPREAGAAECALEWVRRQSGALINLYAYIVMRCED